MKVRYEMDGNRTMEDIVNEICTLIYNNKNIKL